MRLHVSAKADYALRALAVLGAQPLGESVKSAEIARREAMPVKFLENILVDLRRKGLVVSHRGPTGGFRLARPAAAISIADVLRAVDGDSVDVRSHGATARAMPARAIEHMWAAAELSIRHVLETITVDDLARDELPTHVEDLLVPPAGPARRLDPAV